MGCLLITAASSSLPGGCRDEKGCGISGFGALPMHSASRATPLPSPGTTRPALVPSAGPFSSTNAARLSSGPLRMNAIVPTSSSSGPGATSGIGYGLPGDHLIAEMWVRESIEMRRVGWEEVTSGMWETA